MGWLGNAENRLACFGGAGSKSAYGGKAVVKPSTAYNALAQAVNKKFGCLWDGDSAKSRVRTMKGKFHTVFTMSNGGRVQEENASLGWILTAADKEANIFTLADKAQSMCPHWNSWFEWCGNDPNMNKHGSGTSDLVGGGDDAGEDVEGGGNGGPGEGESHDELRDDDGGAPSRSDDDDDDAAHATFSGFSSGRQAAGDKGNVGETNEGEAEGGEGVPRAVSARVEPAPGAADALKEQARRRRERLAAMNAEQKKEFYSQEAKAKRQKEQKESDDRRATVAAAASPTGTGNSSSGSPFAKNSSQSYSKDWQANFLVEHRKEETLRAERQDASQLVIAKLHIESADRNLAFQQLQFTSQQQQAHMQLQFQQQQQLMYMQMKQHEFYCQSVVQTARSKSEFMVAALAAKIPWDTLE
jgi:hypothetical protein